MTNRIGPMDPAFTGKIGNKLNEASTSKVNKDNAAPTAAQPAPTATPGDTVELTRDGKLLEQLDKTLASLPVIDQNRVAEVRAAIEKGDYQIDAVAIADAMIRMERSLGE